MPGKNQNRIYQIFDSRIELDELSITKQYDDANQGQQPEDVASMRYPLIRINGYTFHSDEIERVKIDSTEFLPTISVTLATPTKVFLTRDFPKDGDILSIMIRHKTDVLKPVRNDYIITSASSRKLGTDVGGTVVNISGELFVPGLKSYLEKLTFEGTSMEILKEAAKSLDLGFSTNERNTNDKQIWYITDTIEDLFKDTTAKAWKDEDSFFDCWIDIYYNFNFINLQKQLLSTEDEIDLGAIIGNIDKGMHWGEDTSEENTLETAKVFSDLRDFVNTSFYITDWKSVNNSTNITFRYGSRMLPGIFEHLRSVYEDPNSKEYWNPEITPKYDPDKSDEYIILRGRPTYDPNNDPNSQARANYNIPAIYKNSPWMGIQYTINNPEEDNSRWTGNHHANYKRAQVHNLINRVELDKLNVHISVRGKNMNIIKGDKIPIMLRKKTTEETQSMDAQEDANEQDAPSDGEVEMIDNFYSGWYIVKGFNITFENPPNKQVDNMYSMFSQTFILTRREWPPPLPTEKENA